METNEDSKNKNNQLNRVQEMQQIADRVNARHKKDPKFLADIKALFSNTVIVTPIVFKSNPKEVSTEPDVK